MPESLSHLNRRSFIKVGSSAVLYPFLFFGIGSCGLIGSPVDWKTKDLSVDDKGQLEILQVDGTAVSEAEELKPGVRIESRRTIELKEGVLVASLPDNSIIKLSKNAVVTFKLDSRQGGTMHLRKGGMLAVVNKSRAKPYLIRTANAMIGVKGTVCYSNILTREELEEFSIPGPSADYFCLCNGGIDFLNEGLDQLKSDRSDYHNPYFIRPGKERAFIEPTDNLINHTDEEIFELIQRMKGRKHETGWLSLKDEAGSYN